jgi:outer membrane protein assembly factor BamE
LLLAVACARSDGDFKLPGVYRINIQQGNVIEQQMLDRLKPGMAKSQVRFIMGTPTIIDPFHPDRWEYIYTFTQGASQRQQRRLTLYFEEDKLAYLDGDVQTSLRKPPENYGGRSKIVEVPDRGPGRLGLLENIKKAIPFVGDDKPIPAPPPEEAGDGETAAPPGAPVETAPPESGTADTQPEAGKPEEPKQEKGFFGRLLDKLPGRGGDDETEQPAVSQQ